jgi:pimeloyl-ACP methyl ester carboxylesterase
MLNLTKMSHPSRQRIDKMVTTPTIKLSKIPFDCDSYRINGFDLSFLDSGGEKPPLHFYHANGFPISTYLPLLTSLTEGYRVIGLGLRGQDAQSAGNTSWRRIAQDLICFLDDKHPGPVLGVGHSVGGVTTMMAAVKRPDLFSRIILIDPVIHSYRFILGLAIKRLLRRKKISFIAQRARARKYQWADRNELYEYCKTKSLFSRFDDTFLRSYVTYGAKPANDGSIELVCPPEAEARIFENYPLDVWSWIQRLKVPVLIIRGEYSDVLTQDCVDRFCSKAVNAERCLVPGAGHLIPMEKPKELLAVIKAFSGQ